MPPRQSSVSAQSATEDAAGAKSKRACDVCHGMKVKCIDKDDPPCKRCRALGIECSFDRRKPAVPTRTDRERLLSLESQMDSVHSMLQNITGLLERHNAAPSPVQPVAATTSRLSMGSSTFPHQATAHKPGAGDTHPSPKRDPPYPLSGRRPSFSDGPTLAQWVQSIDSPTEVAVAPTPYPGPVPSASSAPLTNWPHHRPSPGGRTVASPVMRRSGPSPGGVSHVGSTPMSHPSVGSAARVPESPQDYAHEEEEDDGQLDGDDDDEEDDDVSDGGDDGDKSTTGDEVDENDPLRDRERVAPMRGMLQREEADRLRSDGHPGWARRAKRRLSGNESDGTVQEVEDNGEPGQVGEHREKRRRVSEMGVVEEEEEVQDPIELGIVSASEGRRLFDLFFEGASVYMPVFDPATDTWDEIRARSPLCLTTILMIGQMSADAGVGRTSALRMRLKAHAEKMAMSTLFSPISSVQIVQAMLLLAAWGDTVWRPGNHAISMAVDMGLYRCLPHLVSTGMGEGKTGAALEADRRFVAGARVWLALTKLKLEMALNHGRPMLIPDDETVQHARRLLDHPLSIPADSRCIAACELMTHRQIQIQPFIVSGYVDPAEVDAMLRAGNKDYDLWEEYWIDHYARQGRGPGDFLVSELAVQKSHSILHFNYLVLHGVHSRYDVQCLPPQRKHWLVVCLETADKLVARMAQPAELANLRFANHYAFVAVAFAAQYLIRLARILPGVIDLHRAVKNVTTLATKLDQFPGFSFREMLTEAAARARRKHGIPESKVPTPAGSPRGGGTRLTSMTAAEVPSEPAVEAEAWEEDGVDWASALGALNMDARTETAWLDFLMDGGGGQDAWLEEFNPSAQGF